jgi:drug/metabolite transporter (DMT)-like permease
MLNEYFLIFALLFDLHLPAMLSKYKYHIWLHLTIVIFGLTGILGKLITTDSYLLVWYRLGIALVGVLIYFAFTKFSLKITKRELIRTSLVGIIIAVHWVTFFEAIKQSNVSVALVCFSSSTLFTALLEPIYFKRKIKAYELIFGILIITGLYFIFSFEFKYLVGMILSVVSAALASWFTVLNGILIKETKAKLISFYELLGAFIVVSLYLLVTKNGDITQFSVPVEDIKWLIILGTLCTAFAFIMGVEVMKKISPYTVTISVNLEPIYSIILALLIWPESETMSFGFYMGTIIVIATIFLNALFKNKFSKEKKAPQ